MTARGRIAVLTMLALAAVALRYLPTALSILGATRTLLAVDISSVIQPKKGASA